MGMSDREETPGRTQNSTSHLDWERPGILQEWAEKFLQGSGTTEEPPATKRMDVSSINLTVGSSDNPSLQFGNHSIFYLQLGFWEFSVSIRTEN